MKLINRYLLREIYPIFIIGNVFFLFLLLIEKLVKLAELFFSKNVPAHLLIETIIFYLPSLFVVTIPTATLMATLIAFSRLSSDSELIAMQAIGARNRTLLAPSLLFGFFAFLLGLLCSTYLMPIGSSLAIGNLNKIVKTVSISDLREKELYDEIPGILFYVNKKKSDTSFQELIIIDRKSGTVITSESGDIKPSANTGLMMNLKNGRITTSPKEDRNAIISFRNFTFNVPVNIGGKGFLENERLMPMKDMLDRFSEGNEFRYEFMKRISLPFSALIMVVFGYAFGKYLKRGGGKSLGVFIALFVVFVNNMLFFTFENLALSGEMEPFLAAWMPVLIFGVAAFFSLLRVR